MQQQNKKKTRKTKRKENKHAYTRVYYFNMEE